MEFKTIFFAFQFLNYKQWGNYKFQKETFLGEVLLICNYNLTMNGEYFL